MLQDIGNPKEFVSTRKSAKTSRLEKHVPALRVITISRFHILAFPASNLSYIAFSNSVIIFSTVISPGGFTCPPYNPQSPASRSINCKLWLAYHSQTMSSRNTIATPTQNKFGNPLQTSVFLRLHPSIPSLTNNPPKPQSFLT